MHANVFALIVRPETMFTLWLTTVFYIATLMWMFMDYGDIGLYLIEMHVTWSMIVSKAVWTGKARGFLSNIITDISPQWHLSRNIDLYTIQRFAFTIGFTYRGRRWLELIGNNIDIFIGPLIMWFMNQNQTRDELTNMFYLTIIAIGHYCVGYVATVRQVRKSDLSSQILRGKLLPDHEVGDDKIRLGEGDRLFSAKHPTMAMDIQHGQACCVFEE